MTRHTYLKQINPTVEVGVCEKRAYFVEVRWSMNVLMFCEDGHLIKGKAYPTSEKARAIATRLERWIAR
jgi:hypothetical protein